MEISKKEIRNKCKKQEFKGKRKICKGSKNKVDVKIVSRDWNEKECVEVECKDFK